MICLISTLPGYLLGSRLPAYYFGRLTGVDIRNEGAKHAGTMHVYQVVGRNAAIVTAIFDLSNGLLAIHAPRPMEAKFHYAQLRGLAAVAAQGLPFYLIFRGSQGVTYVTDFPLYCPAQYLTSTIISFNTLLFLALIVLNSADIAHQGEVIGVIFFLLLYYARIIQAPADDLNPYLLMIILYFMGLEIRNLIARKSVAISYPLLRHYWYRVLLQPLAMIFVLDYWHLYRTATLVLIGSLALILSGLDFVRLRSKAVNEELINKIQPLFKKKELGRCSSISLFLGAAFLTVLIFDKMIAIASIIFLVFGNLSGKIFGLAYGRQRIWNKTVEGGLAFFGAGLIATYIISTATTAPFAFLFFGTIVATIVEALPLSIDVNFSVSLASATAMMLAQKLLIAL